MDELHVLLVDDEESYLRTAAKIFKRNGIETVICSDGRNVPSLARARKCQVVVLDLKLPGVDGLDVLRKLKRFFPPRRSLYSPDTPPRMTRPCA